MRELFCPRADATCSETGAKHQSTTNTHTRLCRDSSFKTRSYEQVIYENLLRRWVATGEVEEVVKTGASVNKTSPCSADSPEKLFTCCVRVKNFPQCSRLLQNLYIFLGEFWSFDSTRRQAHIGIGAHSTELPACTPPREGGKGFVVTASLPVNENKVTDNR